MIVLVRDPVSGDFEIKDESVKSRGFIWEHGGRWAVRVDQNQTQFRKTYDEAAVLAHKLVGSSAHLPDPLPINALKQGLERGLL